MLLSTSESIFENGEDSFTGKTGADVSDNIHLNATFCLLENLSALSGFLNERIRFPVQSDKIVENSSCEYGGDIFSHSDSILWQPTEGFYMINYL